MQRLLRGIDSVIYWSIILIPFAMAISNAPMNVFIGFLIAAFLFKKILKKESFICNSGIKFPLFVLFLLTLFSLTYSHHFKDTLVGGIFRLFQYIFVFFAVCSEIKDKKHIYFIICSVAAGLLFVSFDAIWQVISGRDFIRGYAPIVNIGLVRATASFSDANTFGIYLSAITPLFFGLTLYFWKGLRRIPFILISLIGLLAIALTYSRPTLLAAYIALIFLAVARKNKILILILILFTLASPFILPKSVKEFAKEMDYNPIRFMCNDDRIAIYRNAIQMIKASPIIGHGANTFDKNYKQYKEIPEYRGIVTADRIYAHNNFLHMAGEIGLLGLFFFLWFLYKLFKENSRIYKEQDDYFCKIVSISLIACLIAFLVNGLTESSLYYSRVALIFWYLAGLSLSLKKFAHSDGS